jgi:hypothetical protein
LSDTNSPSWYGSVERQEACVLAWSLTQRTRAVISREQIEALHTELQQCANLVGAELIEVNAASGMLKCDDQSARVTPADTALRCGQLLCRWATQQMPRVGLRVGMACGIPLSVELPCRAENGVATRSYFGTAVSTAKYMVETAPREMCVHFGDHTKNKLQVFERLPFSIGLEAQGVPMRHTVSGNSGNSVQVISTASCVTDPGDTSQRDTYYLEPWVEAVDVDGELDESQEYRQKSNWSHHSRTETARHPGLDADMPPSKVYEKLQAMSEGDFCNFLMSYNVDLANFGKGYAKSVADFQKEIVEEKKSCLCTRKGQLQRQLELVRISLYARGPDGMDRHLMLTMEIMEDGRARARHQKLACVVMEGTTWKQAVTQTIKEKFGVPEDYQKDNIVLEGNWFKEENIFSPSYPGIKTVYLTHEVRMRIGNPQHCELSVMGLPTMRTFTTGADGGPRYHWAWSADTEQISNADSLTALLQEHRFSHLDFEPAAFADLVTEIYEEKTSTLIVRNGELLRHLDIVKVWVQAEIFSVTHYLVAKSKVQYGKRESGKDRPISMRMSSNQTWQEAARQALNRNLGIELHFQQEFTSLDEASFVKREEVEYSQSYPGLKSVYRIHEVTVRVLQTSSFDCFSGIGLPEGNSFSFRRHENIENIADDVKRVVVTTFHWVPAQDIIKKDDNLMCFKRSLVDEKRAPIHTFKSGLSQMSGLLRIVVSPNPIAPPAVSEWKSPYLAQELMRDKATDWDRARTAARRIREKDYHCGLFLEDCIVAFPELSLYVVNNATVSSGRSPDEEYQRTIGALFAFYWLMRLDIDGAEGFSFGLTETFQSMKEGDAFSPARTPQEMEKRSRFFREANWAQFRELTEHAGLRTSTSTGLNEERVLAMLVLTAIHDIMKLTALLPRVHESVAGFGGYGVGEEIGDHDIALGYLLTHAPQALPSYRGMSGRSQELVRFTQGQLQYNMGWFVQAEAPPGILLSKFKAIVGSGRLDPSDLSFYFVHWLTDLAGAEGHPMEGCEKFALKFPPKVLMSFLCSFRFMSQLSSHSETRVFEDYLKWRWGQTEPPLGPPPRGRGAVAKMRLVVMAQSHAKHVAEAYENLMSVDRDILDEELARTGLVNQSFESDPVTPAGPSFLVYYGPALMQKNCAANPTGAMRVMAEVLRQARVLWPIDESDSSISTTVIVRIDAIKELNLEDLVTMPAGNVWVLQKTSSLDCQVKKLFLDSEIDWSSSRMMHFKVPTPVQRTFSGSPQEASPSNRQSLMRRRSSANKKTTLPDVSEEESTSPAQACYSCPFGAGAVKLRGMLRTARSGRSPGGASR